MNKAPPTGREEERQRECKDPHIRWSSLVVVSQFSVPFIAAGENHFLPKLQFQLKIRGGREGGRGSWNWREGLGFLLQERRSGYVSSPHSSVCLCVCGPWHVHLKCSLYCFCWNLHVPFPFDLFLSLVFPSLSSWFHTHWCRRRCLYQNFWI